MIGLTATTPSYAHLAPEAERRFSKQSGLAVRTIQSKEEGFLVKLRLSEVRQEVVFFDSDLWLLKPVDFHVMPDWSVVHDPCVFHPDSFCYKDCEQPFEKGGLLRDHYFNTGLMKVDLRRKENREVFRHAARLARNAAAGKAWKPFDKTDQYYINRAALECGVRVHLLPYSFNYYHKSVEWGVLSFTPREIVGLHAAGYPLRSKLSVLRAQAKVFGGKRFPMQPMALRYKHATTFEV